MSQALAGPGARNSPATVPGLPWLCVHNDGPIGAGLPVTYLWMPAAAVVALAAALPIFDRRDIAAA